MEEYISLENCEEGFLYAIEARNASVGIFIKEKSGFVIPRYKFGYFLFTEDHWDTGEPHGTVRPFFKLEKIPPEIETALEQGDEEEVLKYLLERNIEFIDIRTS